MQVLGPGTQLLAGWCTALVAFTSHAALAPYLSVVLNLLLVSVGDPASRTTDLVCFAKSAGLAIPCLQAHTAESSPAGSLPPTR